MPQVLKNKGFNIPVFKTIALVSLFLSIVFAFLLLKHLWVPGIFLNGDHALHYSLLACFKETDQWFLFGAWCQYLPQWASNYAFFPPLFFLSIWLLSFVFGVELAYKVFLLLVLLFIPSVVFSILFYHKRYVAAAVSFPLLLFFDSGVKHFGFSYLFLWGGVPQTLGWGLFLLNVFLLHSLFVNHTRKKAFAVVVLNGLLFVTHPLIFLFYCSAALVLCLWRWRTALSLWKFLLFLCLFVFLFAGFWLVPLFFKTFFAASYGLLPPQPSDIGFSLVPFWNLNNGIPFFARVLGLFGLCLLLIRNDELSRFFRFIAVFFVFVVVINLLLVFSFPSARYFLSLVRMAQLFGILLVVGFGFFLDWVSWLSLPKISFFPQRFVKPLCVLVLFFLAGFPMFGTVSKSAGFVITSGDNRLGLGYPSDGYFLMTNLMKVKQGRLLAEDFYLQHFVEANRPSWSILYASTRFWIPLALIAKKEVVSVYHAFTFQQNAVTNEQKLIHTLASFLEAYAYSFKRPLNFSSPTEAVREFDYFNANYVLSLYPRLHDVYSDMEKVWQQDSFFMYFRNSTPSYFMIVNTTGNITVESFNDKVGEVVVNVSADGFVLFKQSVWPNWKVFVDNTAQMVEADSFGFMLVNVPSGVHKVRFVYSMLWYEYLGVILTVISVFLLILSYKWNIY